MKTSTIFLCLSLSYLLLAGNGGSCSKEEAKDNLDTYTEINGAIHCQTNADCIFAYGICEPSGECAVEPAETECRMIKCQSCGEGFTNSYRIDEDGCKTCECIAEPVTFECPKFKCKACDNGYIVDNNGCNTCGCLEPETDT